MPLMIVNSPTAPPEYFNPCDIFKLCAARGDFTVDSDRDAVNETLTKMLKAKVEAYGKEDITVARLLQVFSPLFVPREAYYAPPTGWITSNRFSSGEATPRRPRGRPRRAGTS